VRGIARVAVALILLAVAGIVLMPAAWLDGPLATRTHSRMRLTAAEGSWWRGHALLATADGAARVPIAWRLALAPLLTGTLVVALQPGNDEAMPSGTLALRRGSLDVRDLHVRVPAAFVPAFVPALAALALGGDIDLRAPTFMWHNGAATGTFDATWQRARAVAGAFSVDLGVVSVSAVPQRGGLVATLRNIGGDVVVDGTAGEHDGALDVALGLRPASGASDAVRAMLPMLGESDGTGGVRISWRGRP
jgi:hypothetical protein